MQHFPVLHYTALSRGSSTIQFPTAETRLQQLNEFGAEFQPAHEVVGATRSGSVLYSL